MPESTTEQFLKMVDEEAHLADMTSSCLNYVAIAVAIGIAAITLTAALAAATDLWSKTTRAVLAGTPGFFAAVLALLNPRVDWHRQKEIGLEAIASAVRFEGLTIREASKLRSELERSMEGSWQKAKAPAPIQSAAK